MGSQLVSMLHRPLSSVRLESYRPPGGTDQEMILNYFWNMKLSEALYPALGSLEIALRNCIHASATEKYGTEFWFDGPGVLEARQRGQLATARSQLTKSETAGRLVAQLTFGFWVGLLNSPYEGPMWHVNRASMLKSAFPNVPTSQRSRGAIFHRIYPIQQLRNRIFHHEPIWHRPTLETEYDHIIEALGWMSQELASAINRISSFGEVHSHGKDLLRAGIPELNR